MSGSEPHALTAPLVNQHIDDVLQDMNPILERTQRPVLKRVTDWTTLLPSDVRMDTPWYFGMLATSPLDPGPPKKSDLLSFYIGYSTWDGRCLFLDQLPEGAEESEQLYLKTLARIAQRIGSKRLTWKRRPIPKWDQDGPPRVSDDLLVLRMDRPAMASYAGSGEFGGGKAFDRTLVEQEVNECLEARRSAQSNIQIRLAGATDADADAMARLVRGLAIYTEAGEEAVRCTAHDYLVDGGGSEPLYYCLLIDHIDTSTGEFATCGIAVVYFGYYMKEGRFLYLEDLYVEEAYRSKGAGSTTLKALAELGLRLDCASFYWLALEWNRPALEMYTKIAEVQEGLKVHTYADEKLTEFAEGLRV